MSGTAAGRSAITPENSGLGDADGSGGAAGVGPARRFLARPARLAVEPGTAAADSLAQLRGRLMTPLPDDGIWGWFWRLLVTVFAGILRFGGLSSPDAINFDETYYAKDAW